MNEEDAKVQGGTTRVNSINHVLTEIRKAEPPFFDKKYDPIVDDAIGENF